jgi:hypothetical protein
MQQRILSKIHAVYVYAKLTKLLLDPIALNYYLRPRFLNFSLHEQNIIKKDQWFMISVDLLLIW